MKNKHKSFSRTVLQMLAGAGVGLALGLCIGAFLSQVDPGRQLPLYLRLLCAAALLLWCALWYVLSVPIHEGGHLICGLLTGYRFVSFRAGRFICYRRQGKLRIGRYQIAGTGGQCLLGPPGASPDAPFPYVLYNLGGALANFVVGGCFLALSFACPQPARLLLMLAGAVNIAMGVPNLIPMKSMTTDGTNLLLARRSGEARRALWLTLAVNEQLTDGVRPRDLPADWFRLGPPAPEDDPLVAGVKSLVPMRLADEGRLDEAAAAYRALLDGCPRLIEVQKQEIRCDLLLLELLRGDRAAARALDTPELRRYRRQTAGTPGRLCLDCAVAALLHGDEAAANTARAAFEQAAARHPLSDAALYRDLLARVGPAAAQAQ